MGNNSLCSFPEIFEMESIKVTKCARYWHITNFDPWRVPQCIDHHTAHGQTTPCLGKGRDCGNSSSPTKTCQVSGGSTTAYEQVGACSPTPKHQTSARQARDEVHPPQRIEVPYVKMRGMDKHSRTYQTCGVSDEKYVGHSPSPQWDTLGIVHKTAPNLADSFNNLAKVSLIQPFEGRRHRRPLLYSLNLK